MFLYYMRGIMFKYRIEYVWEIIFDRFNIFEIKIFLLKKIL